MNRGTVDIVRLGPRRDVVFGPICEEPDVEEVLRQSRKILDSMKEIGMHYKNGRAAKNGDKVMVVPNALYGGVPLVGILYNAKAGNDFCNGNLAVTKPNDPCPNLADCLHVDDVNAFLGDISKVPDTSATKPVSQ